VERLENEAAQLIRDAAASADRDRDRDRESGRGNVCGEQDGDAIEGQSAPQQQQQAGDERMEMRRKEEKVNEYSELERLLTTFIYEEAPKKRSRL